MKSKTKVGLFLATLLSLSLSAHDSSAHEHNDHKLGDQLKADADLKSGSQEHEHDSKLASFIGVEEYISLSGTIGLYGQTMDANDDNIDRDELAAIYGALHLETREWQGFRLGLTALAHGELHDHNDNYNEYYDNNAALLAEAFLKYNYKETEFTLGRQGVDWLMLGDYFEGVFVESEAIEDFLIRAAWVHKGAVFDPDEMFDYDELNDDDGVFGTEITYNGIEGLAITGLYYQAPDAYDIYGGEVFHEYAFCDKWSNAFLVQYFETDEKSSFADYPSI
ncbi:hypothetical protein LNTAR_08216 [Lentisphaera araneosa HTCC2155]|uniref:Uncharacterized protein n=1 Tax=Lentisphaera araneosa HTCC2155 TaxID=313628 RepID=A6DS17_9BACT|nr:Opr family porin [Lentisphaera araneosa]EDM25592.1 hypothetical protein LNTAR_08216 [Lentisphaera araneosa HTCC2155]